jgi:predicted neuraminidase
MRQHGCDERRLWTATTADGGMSWTAARPLALANPDSPAAAFRLADGRILAVLNDDPAVASRLDLFISGDEGATWRPGPPLFAAAAGGDDYRYPWLLQDAAGRLHVFVSETKRAIRHVVFGTDDIPE